MSEDACAPQDGQGACFTGLLVHLLALLVHVLAFTSAQKKSTNTEEGTGSGGLSLTGVPNFNFFSSFFLKDLAVATDERKQRDKEEKELELAKHAAGSRCTQFNFFPFFFLAEHAGSRCT